MLAAETKAKRGISLGIRTYIEIQRALDKNDWRNSCCIKHEAIGTFGSPEADGNSK